MSRRQAAEIALAAIVTFETNGDQVTAHYTGEPQFRVIGRTSWLAKATLVERAIPHLVATGELPVFTMQARTVGGSTGC